MPATKTLSHEVNTKNKSVDTFKLCVGRGGLCVSACPTQEGGYVARA